jgi:hypothetical protein
MAAGLWCLCSYPLLAILESGLPWMTPPFEYPCAQVGRPHVPSGSWAGLLLPIVVPQRPSVGYLLPLFVSACARPHPSAPAWDGLSGNIAGLSSGDCDSPFLFFMSCASLSPWDFSDFSQTSDAAILDHFSRCEYQTRTSLRPQTSVAAILEHFSSCEYQTRARP